MVSLDGRDLHPQSAMGCARQSWETRQLALPDEVQELVSATEDRSSSRLKGKSSAFEAMIVIYIRQRLFDIS